MKYDSQDKPILSFGLFLGGIFGVIASWAMIFHCAEARCWAGVVVAVLIYPHWYTRRRFIGFTKVGWHLSM